MATVRRSLPYLTDTELADALETALDALAPRARAFALAVASGKPAKAAAREVGASDNREPVSRMKKRAATAMALLREQARRKSVVTAEETARWFEALAQDAWEAKDYSAARGARAEAARIRGLYPEMRIRLGIEQEIELRDVTPEEWEAVALLKHGVRRQLPAIEAEFTNVTSARSGSSPEPPQPIKNTARALSMEGKEAPDAA